MRDSPDVRQKRMNQILSFIQRNPDSTGAKEVCRVILGRDHVDEEAIRSLRVRLPHADEAAVRTCYDVVCWTEDY